MAEGLAKAPVTSIKLGSPLRPLSLLPDLSPRGEPYKTKAQEVAYGKDDSQLGNENEVAGAFLFDKNGLQAGVGLKQRRNLAFKNHVALMKEKTVSLNRVFASKNGIGATSVSTRNSTVIFPISSEV